jgi:predicted transcriptional regulator
VVENGCLKGIVTLNCVKEVANSKWAEHVVADVMTPPRDDLLVTPEKDALEALVQVTKSGLGRLLVVEEGCLLGIASQRDLLKLFEIKTHLSA